MILTVKQAYDNIEKAITQGFMTVGVSYADHYLLLKNITDKEYGNFYLYRKENDAISDTLYHLAFCTAFIDSENFLVNRPDSIKDLVSFYRRMPVTYIRKIRDTIKSLNTEYLESLKFLEGFCYTDRSRYLWKILNTTDKDSYLGINGLNNVGMSSVYENWLIVNKRLDDEESYERDFNLSLIIASSMNSKGTKILSRNYESHKKELDELRKDIAIHGYDKKRVEDQKKQAEWTAPLKSREDLVRELYRQMNGQKDKHDLFIDQWIKQQQEAATAAKDLADSRQKEFRAKLSEVDLSAVEASKPISASELNRLLSDKKLSKRDVPANQYMSAFENMDQKERFIKKMGSTIISSDKKG